MVRLRFGTADRDRRRADQHHRPPASALPHPTSGAACGGGRDDLFGIGVFGAHRSPVGCRDICRTRAALIRKRPA